MCPLLRPQEFKECRFVIGLFLGLFSDLFVFVSSCFKDRALFDSSAHAPEFKRLSYLCIHRACWYLACHGQDVRAAHELGWGMPGNPPCQNKF